VKIGLGFGCVFFKVYLRLVASYELDRARTLESKIQGGCLSGLPLPPCKFRGNIIMSYETV
jgi:hypothetical protein